MAEQPEDPCWLKLNGREWTCSSCRATHLGVVDLGFDHPDGWEGSAETSANSVVPTADNVLTRDFCIIDGQQYFVRCVLELPLVGWAGEAFAYGVWSSLSPKNFALYRETFDKREHDGLGPWFGWFSNSLKAYPETLSLKCQVHPRPGRQRPTIELEATEHPLAIEQRDGITFDRLLEIYALHGHDVGDVLRA